MVIKVLVIGHSNLRSTYGAATSIRNHFLSFSENADFEFYHIFRRGMNWKPIGRQFPKPASLVDVKEMWLPIDEDIFHHVSPGLIKSIYGKILPNIISILFRTRLVKKIKSINPDLIHLNSIVLWPLIEILRKDREFDSVKIVMHVRELCDKKGVVRAFNALSEVDSFIFIDHAVRKQFEKNFALAVSFPCHTVKNPFEARELADHELQDIFESDKANFCVAGVIGEDKGVEFICNAFSDFNPTDSRLLILGKENKLLKKIKLENRCANIVFMGEIDRLSERGGFRYIDCVVRGETTFCTGRTTYEVLYAGGYVIMPGTISDIEDDRELCRFKEQVIFYKPRNSNSLRVALRQAEKIILHQKSNNIARPLLTNFPDYKKYLSEIYHRAYIKEE